MCLAVGFRWAPLPSSQSSSPSPPSFPHRHTWIRYVFTDFFCFEYIYAAAYLRAFALGAIVTVYRMLTVKSDLNTLVCVCVCRAGAGFLLQSEGAWLSHEERAGSFRNHQAEPALDGQEPLYTPKMALIQALHPVSAPLTGRRVVKTTAVFALL